MPSARTCFLSFFLAGFFLAVPAAAEPPAEQPGERFLDLGAVQGLLAVQGVDGWLLYENRGQNPVAAALVSPAGQPTRRWFYWIPAEGEPVALVHKVDAGLFARVSGKKVTFTGHEELKKQLAAILSGVRRVAMEYSPKAELPDISRVDAGTLELVRGRRIKIQSSAELVQVASSTWGPAGRIAHYVAAHHLARLRDQALAFVAARVKAQKPVTELDVQRVILAGYAVRGLTGPAPVVAAGVHTADPGYTPEPGSRTLIKEGDLVRIEMRARLVRAERPVFAETVWMAYVGKSVPARHAELFSVVARARDTALFFIRERAARRRAVRGHEVDAKAREVIVDAGHGARFPHRTGHSLDTTAHSAAVALDGYETRDSRPLVPGAGVAIAPGVYMDGEFGVRSAVTVHLVQRGVEITMPAQTEITALLAP